MKCAKCGADMKVGRMYCSVCGHEARIVPDYNLLEDDMLLKLLNEEDELGKRNAKKKPKAKKNKSKKPLIISSAIFVVLLTVVIVAVVLVNNKNEASFVYQYEKGEAYFNEKDYNKSLTYFTKALKLDDSSIDARMQLVLTHLALRDETAAILMLQEIIDIDNTNQEAYEILIGLYQGRKDYASILKQKEEVVERKFLEQSVSSLDSDSNIKWESILSLFSEYEVEKPEFDLAPGIYTDYVEVNILAEAASDIYYTSDGSDPKENGIKYTDSIKLKEQAEMTLRAIAYNENGFYSEELTGKFMVRFKRPDMPGVHPDSGSFSEPVSITVSMPEGATVYYTWGGSVPTEDSKKYTGPLSMPEGNNILSLLLVDKYGMKSEVLKCNYKYMP